MNRRPLAPATISLPESYSDRPRSGWTHLHSAVGRAAALLLPLCVVLIGEPTTVPILLLVLAVTTVWHCWFARARAQAMGIDLLVSAMLLVVMLPWGFTWWQLVLAVTFGAVLGELIFGGRGYGFLHPVIVTLAFLLYSFPGVLSTANDPLLTASLLPGAVLLLYYRLIDYRVVMAMIAGILGTSFFITGILPQTIPGSIVLCGLLFAGCDPAVGAITRCGRIIHGLLIGMLVTSFDTTLSTVSAVVFACLLGSIIAPLIDWTVIYLHCRTRQRSHV